MSRYLEIENITIRCLWVVNNELTQEASKTCTYSMCS